MRMSAKDTVIGTGKRIVAEIVGDGRLAEEGARQTHESSATADAEGRPLQERTTTPNTSAYSETPLMNENRFAALLGHAALKVWSDLPRDAQERLFAAAVDDGVIANDLAEFLHDRHPRTAHPPKPTRFA
jgi:hypothetical protein